MNSSVQQLMPEEFPYLLREIPDPPEKLYLQGVLPSQHTAKSTNDTKFLCVVGSRKYSSYGKEVCEKLIAGLRGYNISIVSGLALGMDGIAHRAALGAGLHTIAILGSGLGWNVLYPAAHRNLAKQIIGSGGALLSEFKEDFRATPYSFPQRNRIMAGISHAVLVIEAEERSGTLITSRLATDYNRDILTVPTSIFSKNSAGPHMLLRLGATPITKSKDILESLDIEHSDKLWTPDVQSLSENEQKVVVLLQNPLPRDELIEQLGLPVQEVQVLLSAMEIKGLITERLGEIRTQKDIHI